MFTKNRQTIAFAWIITRFHDLYTSNSSKQWLFNCSQSLNSHHTYSFSFSSEQPIFTCQAHVFHIDPKTKRTWITASTKAISVSFFYDSSRNLYRIISVEGTKVICEFYFFKTWCPKISRYTFLQAVINSTITPNMTFTQTSQKFGQWSDVRANTVYGLGFASEAELGKFIEKFHEVKEATKNAMAKASTNGSSAVTPVTSANASPITSRSSITQNDSFVSDIPEPPSVSSSIVSKTK